jgi:hypothetical protein
MSRRNSEVPPRGAEFAAPSHQPGESHETVDDRALACAEQIEAIGQFDEAVHLLDQTFGRFEPGAKGRNEFASMYFKAGQPITPDQLLDAERRPPSPSSEKALAEYQLKSEFYHIISGVAQALEQLDDITHLEHDGADRERTEQAWRQFFRVLHSCDWEKTKRVFEELPRPDSSSPRDEDGLYGMIHQSDIRPLLSMLVTLQEHDVRDLAALAREDDELYPSFRQELLDMAEWTIKSDFFKSFLQPIGRYADAIREFTRDGKAKPIEDESEAKIAELRSRIEKM